MTPSFSGRMARICPGVRPSIALASRPMAIMDWSASWMATIEGSLRMIPTPRLNTKVFAVPRSIARSFMNPRISRLDSVAAFIYTTPPQGSAPPMMEALEGDGVCNPEGRLSRATSYIATSYVGYELCPSVVNRNVARPTGHRQCHRYSRRGRIAAGVSLGRRAARVSGVAAHTEPRQGVPSFGFRQDRPGDRAIDRERIEEGGCYVRRPPEAVGRQHREPQTTPRFLVNSVGAPLDLLVLLRRRVSTEMWQNPQGCPAGQLADAPGRHGPGTAPVLDGAPDVGRRKNAWRLSSSRSC